MVKKPKKKPVIAFSVADENNIKYFKMMEASLRKFHSKEELPLVLIGGDQLKQVIQQDPAFYYRATPIVAKDLIPSYETVIKLDADQVITGDLSHLWKEKFDIGVVNNSNPRETKAYPVTVWNIHPLSYVNAGLVVMKSEEFVDHWWQLCMSPHFDFYQMREQDLLNILVFYGNYKVNFLDAKNMWHGLISKGYWPDIKLKKGKLVLPKDKEWPLDGDKEIKLIHWAGGNQPGKMNFNLHFKDKVAKHLRKLSRI